MEQLKTRKGPLNFMNNSYPGVLHPRTIHSTPAKEREIWGGGRCPVVSWAPPMSSGACKRHWVFPDKTREGYFLPGGLKEPCTKALSVPHMAMEH